MTIYMIGFYGGNLSSLKLSSAVIFTIRFQSSEFSGKIFQFFFIWYENIGIRIEQMPQ